MPVATKAVANSANFIVIGGSPWGPPSRLLSKLDRLDSFLGASLCSCVSECRDTEVRKRACRANHANFGFGTPATDERSAQA